MAILGSIPELLSDLGLRSSAPGFSVGTLQSIVFLIISLLGYYSVQLLNSQ